MADLVLKDGELVLSGNMTRGDLVVDNGKIVEICGAGYKGKAREEIDCRGKIVMPGVIDAHVHFREPGMTHKEDFLSGSEAALNGGVTFVLDMPNTKPPVLTMEILNEKRDLAREKCKCGIGFYFGVSDDHLAELRKADKDPDVYGFKVYMSESNDGNAFSYDLLDKVFREVSKVVAVHAEDQAIIMENMEKFNGREDCVVHSQIRSDIAAAEAVKKVLHLAKKYDHKVHIAHISSKAELDIVRKFKNSNVTCEVTPHHLFLNVHAYDEMGNFVKTNPPLRTHDDQEALWEAIDEGLIDIVATDHAPHTYEEKDTIYSKAPSGVPGVETLVPLMLDQVSKGRLSFNKVVKLLCERPADIFGIKGKGRIVVGYDADLVICDMNLEKEVMNDHLKTKCKWSPFNGWRLRGWPVKVVREGKLY